MTSRIIVLAALAGLVLASPAYAQSDLDKQAADAQAHVNAATNDVSRKAWQNRLDEIKQQQAAGNPVAPMPSIAPAAPPSPPAIPSPQPSAPIVMPAPEPVQVPVQEKKAETAAPPAAEPAKVAPTTNTAPVKDFASKKPLKDIRAPTMAAIGQILAPYNDKKPENAEAAKALDILKQNHLTGTPVASSPPTGLADKLGQAMMMGSRSKDFLPELGKLNDALPQGDKVAGKTANALWTKAGRTSQPADKDMKKMLSDARDARASVMQPPQHGSIDDAAGNDIQVDSSPYAGISRISVIIPDGQDGAPERVTFGGQEQTSPDPSHTDLKPTIVPDPPRVVTQKDAQKERADVNGTWTDQDGEAWEISGSGDAMQFVNTYPDGHKVAYDGQWALGLPNATHLVNDVADMNDDLPGDVKAGLAETYHPPFALRLEYLPDQDEFTGMWISGQVTYSGMAHVIKIVEDPTWDKPLILTRNAAEDDGEGSGAGPKEQP